MDLELCRKMLNTMLLSNINSEFPAQELMKRNMPETGLMATDAELVYVLDLPKGLESDGTTTFTIDGLEGFSVTTAEENDGSRLVLRVRKDQNDKGYDTLKGKTVKMTGKVISFHGRSPIQKGHAPKLRFVTENEAIAKFTVKSSNKAGVLKGIDKGTCYVYTCGVNGSWVKTKVTVK